MPKKVITLNDFSGGLNNTSDPRDLTGKQLNVCTNFDPSSPGKLVPTTDGNTVYAAVGDDGVAHHPEKYTNSGAGLFVFRADYQMNTVALSWMDPTAISNATPNPSEFIVCQDGEDIKILEINLTDGTKTWRPATGSIFGYLSFGDTDHDAAPSFFSAEGDLYASVNPEYIAEFGSDGASSTAGSYFLPASIQFINRSHFGTSLKEWNAAHAGLQTAPRHASQTDARHSVDIFNSNINVSYVYDNMVVWAYVFNDEEDSGTWNTDPDDDTNQIEFGSSFVYKNGEESIIKYIGSTKLDDTHASSDLELNKSLKIFAGNRPTAYTFQHNRYGCKLYSRKSGTNEWFYLAEADFERGLKVDGQSHFSPWATQFGGEGFTSSGDLGNMYSATSGWIISPPVLVTYELSHGITEEDRRYMPWFKSGIVANSRAYIGNVMFRNDVWDDEHNILYPDRILKSSVFKYGIFSKEGYIDVGINDGDSIMALSTYADRLLVFKRSSLYIVNISKELEFLESEHKYAGARRSGSIAKTPFGVAWVNGNGCWLYDGESVNSLQLGKISDSEWADNIDRDYAITGYDELNQQLIIVWNSSSAGSGHGYVYSFGTGSWHQFNGRVTSTASMSNFANISDYKLIFAGSETDKQGIIKEWTSPANATSASSSTLTTADLHFGNYESKKNILKLSIAFKSGTTLTVKGRANQGTYRTIGTLSPTDNSFAIWSPDISGTVDSVANAFQGLNTFQLQISGSVDHALEIEDISIIFRDLGVH